MTKILFIILFMIIYIIVLFLSLLYDAKHEPKVPSIFVILVISFIIGRVIYIEKTKYDTVCEHCGIHLMYDDAVEDNNGDYYCYPCAFKHLKYCYICQDYYDIYSIAGSGSSDCCEDCTTKYFERCYFCNWYDCNESNAVSINVNGENYYSCPECMTSYIRKNSISFKN